MADTITYTGTLVVVGCGHPDCAGTTFGMDEGFYNARRRDHRAWWCPRGHERYYMGESDLEKARRRQASAEEDARIYRAEAETERRRAAAYKGLVTKARKRWANGVCPCCKRTFPNVASHMATCHPEELEATR